MLRVRIASKPMRPYWALRFHSFGARSIVHRPDWLRGAHKIAVGEDVIVLRSWLAVERGAWGRPGPALTLGDRVAIAPYVTLSAGESVTIEEDVGIAAGAMIIDFEHLVEGPFDQLARNPLTTAPVRIGRGTGIGQRAAVLGGSTIGENCIISTNSVVRGNIPDGSVVAGVPGRVVGRTRQA